MNKQKALTLAIIVLLIIALISGGILTVYFYSLGRADNDFDELAKIFQESKPTKPKGKESDFKLPAEKDQAQVKQEEVEESLDYGKMFEELQARNSDMVGWLSIPGTQLNYPLMHTPDTPEYYLYRNFDKEYSLSGVPFLDGKSSLDPQTDNLLIHGHNMKNGSMFAQLLAYKDKAFLQAHPIIELYTNDGKQIYDIIAVFPSEVYNSKVFNYHNFINAKDEKEFDAYIESVEGYSLFDTDIEAQYGDQLMTLSTCAYHTANGRFVVVAKARNE